MPLLQVVSCVLVAVGVADRGVLSMYVPHVQDLQGLENERVYFCNWVRNECKYCDAKV
jgi:hypothetical protein